LAHLVEGHQHRHALQDARLRRVLARQQVVLDVELIPARIERRPDAERDPRQPARQGDEGDQQQMLTQLLVRLLLADIVEKVVGS
jgi:hypothetical protein